MKIDKALIENLIERYIPYGNDQVFDAVRYSLFSGGKRLRPILLLEMSKSLGVFDSNMQRLAVALEMIHTYSLIHDDLPCMDDDDFRRGKPTCHKQFTEAHAVLAGDCLLNCAIEVALGGVVEKSYLDAVKHMFLCSGSRGMILGQSMDLFSNPTTVDQLVEIASGKTSALFSAAIVCPAIYANLSKDQIVLLKSIANCLGIAFQVADDLKDGDEKSFLAILGKDECEKLVNNLLQKVYDQVEKLDFDARILVEFAKTIKNCI